ncbi:MAG: hypothetical protein ACI8UO_004436 [Verrucomicrobiales bacterium]|jgi:hypothetical protein
MKRRSAFIVFVLLALSAAAGFGAATIVEDPRLDYVETFQCDDADELIISEIDLNNDGVLDVFITQRGFYNGRQGNIWVLYRSVPNRLFERLDELSGGGVIEFHPKAISFEERENGAGRDLIRYAPSGGGRGYVITFELSSSGMDETVGRQISPGGSDETFFIETFENTDTMLVYTRKSVGEIRAEAAKAPEIEDGNSRAQNREANSRIGIFGWVKIGVAVILAMFVLKLLLKHGGGIIRFIRGRPRIS